MALGITGRTLIKNRIKSWTFNVYTHKLSGQKDLNKGLKLRQLGEL